MSDRTTKDHKTAEDLESVYFWYGDQEYLIEDGLGKMKDTFAREADLDFNLCEIRAGEVGADEIVGACETLPLLTARRLVIVREADRLTPNDRKKLIAYIKEPNPQTTLVLVVTFPADGDTRRMKKVESSALFKAAKGAGEAHKFSLRRVNDAELWLERELGRRGKRVTGDVPGMITERVGVDLRDLSNAVERLCLYAGESETVTRGMVSEVIVHTSDKGVFEMIDALAGRRRDETIYLLNRLLRQGENPRTLLYLMRRQFRLIARAKELEGQLGEKEAVSRLKAHPFVARKSISQARRFTRDRIREIIVLLARVEEEMNAGVFEERFLLERLAMDITG